MGDFMSSTAKLEQIAIAAAAGIKVVLPLVKDGVQLKDALDLFQEFESNEALKAKFMAAGTNIGLADGELKSLDMFGGFRIFRAFMNEYKRA